MAISDRNIAQISI